MCPLWFCNFGNLEHTHTPVFEGAEGEGRMGEKLQHRHETVGFSFRVSGRLVGTQPTPLPQDSSRNRKTEKINVLPTNLQFCKLTKPKQQNHNMLFVDVFCIWSLQPDLYITYGHSLIESQLQHVRGSLQADLYQI